MNNHESESPWAQLLKSNNCSATSGRRLLRGSALMMNEHQF